MHIYIWVSDRENEVHLIEIYEQATFKNAKAMVF